MGRNLLEGREWDKQQHGFGRQRAGQEWDESAAPGEGALQASGEESWETSQDTPQNSHSLPPPSLQGHPLRRQRCPWFGKSRREEPFRKWVSGPSVCFHAREEPLIEWKPVDWLIGHHIASGWVLSTHTTRALCRRSTLKEMEEPASGYSYYFRIQGSDSWAPGFLFGKQYAKWAGCRIMPATSPSSPKVPSTGGQMSKQSPVETFNLQTRIATVHSFALSFSGHVTIWQEVTHQTYQTLALWTSSF